MNIHTLLADGRNMRQQKCLWCRRYVYTDPCISDETKAELVRYVVDNGARWKSKLREHWAQGGEQLRELRNVVGPTKLDGINTKFILRQQGGQQ